MTLATSPFGKIFGGHVRTVPGNTCAKLAQVFPGTVRTLPNLKSVVLIVFELLAFNAEKFRGLRDLGHAPFWKNFGDLVRTVPGKICVKFEVRSFNRF